MIQDPNHRIDGGGFTVLHELPGSHLRRRLLFTYPENRGPEGYQVAQTGEFRYIDREICLYCTQIVQMPGKTGSKMIANGCFWTEDRGECGKDP